MINTPEPIYLDYAATTPVRPEVTAAMEPYLTTHFGNPSSVHSFGRKAATALEEARSRCAEALGVMPSEIIFVRGGTEADNLAIFGRTALARAEGRAPRIAVSSIEHEAVLLAARHAAEPDGECVVLEVRPDGSLDPAALQSVFDNGTDLLSVMWVNNEVGIRLPVEAIAAESIKAGVVFHTDMVQAIGKLPVDLGAVPADLASVTGHKIYGPKGSGLLFVRRGTELAPYLYGGGQERGFRPGTQDVAGAMGLSVAVALAVEEQEQSALRLSSLRDRLEDRLVSTIPGIIVHGGEAARAPHVTNVGIPGVDPLSLLLRLDMEGIAVSAGSACSSGTSKGSHVLHALYGDREGVAALRFSLGRGSTQAHIDRAAEITLRMVQEQLEATKLP